MISSLWLLLVVPASGLIGALVYMSYAHSMLAKLQKLLAENELVEHRTKDLLCEAQRLSLEWQELALREQELAFREKNIRKGRE